MGTKRQFWSRKTRERRPYVAKQHQYTSSLYYGQCSWNTSRKMVIFRTKGAYRILSWFSFVFSHHIKRTNVFFYVKRGIHSDFLSPSIYFSFLFLFLSNSVRFILDRSPFHYTNYLNYTMERLKYEELIITL